MATSRVGLHRLDSQLPAPEAPRPSQAGLAGDDDGSDQGPRSLGLSAIIVAITVAETISHYTIIRKLGAGGMGEVYLAEDSKLRRHAALKVLPEGLAGDENRKRRFLQEAHAASVLNHPNIAVIYEIGEAADGKPFIAMEYIDGTTLDQKIGAKPLPFPEILDIGIEIADALDEAHTKGVMHRDIKPSNVMLNPRGHVKVVDFGLSKLLGEAPEDSERNAATQVKTDSGLVMGTVAYMSPEQALGRPVDHRSDLFSLGVVLYEMATGRLPFAGKTPSETIELIRHTQPDAIARYNYAAPAELERIIRKLMEKEPDNRAQSAREIVVDLKNLRRDSQSGERTAHPVAPPKRRLALPIAAGAVLLAIAAIALMLVLRKRPAEARPDLALQQVTYEPGLESEPSLSRDGKFLAYMSDESGNLDIRVLPTTGGQAIRITDSDADDAQPAWSPDGAKLAFVSARDHKGRLSVPLGVGPLQTYVLGRGGDIFLTSALGGSAVKLVSDGYYPAWSPDGKEIAFQSTREGQRNLWAIGAEGGEPRRLTNDTKFDYHPSWSPDGKWIAYASMESPTEFGIRVIDSKGRQPRSIVTQSGVIVRPIWSADGTAILFSLMSGGRMNVWRAGFDPSAATAGRVERVTVGEGNDVYLSGPDSGGRVAFSTVKTRSDIYELTVEGGAMRQVTSETVIEDYADLSSDGKTLLLTSARDGSQAIWTADLQGKLLTRIAPGSLSRWAPDGQQFAYLTGTPPTIVVQRLGELSGKTVARDAGLVEWSPDGSSLLFERPVGSRRGLFLKNLADGSERQLTPPLVTTAVSVGMSRDGKQIAYQADEAGIRHIFVMPASGGVAKKITSGENESSHPRFRPDAPEWIVYLENHKNIILRSLRTGETRALTNFTESNLVIDYPSWSPDGTKIYFTVARNVGDIFLLENY